jgi:DNA-binding winged helix-turn-helix (wHTH) protein/tetratricopeptide (TPR) repeat protein
VTEARRISFDGWTLDVRTGELAREGNAMRLPPQPLAMLVELLAHAGDVVTRERLVQVLWPKGVVDFDGSLNAVVRKLRVTLGDDSAAPRYIETLPRIGYRFLVQPTIQAKLSTTSAVRSYRPGAAIFVSVLAIASVAAVWQFRATVGPPLVESSAPRPVSDRAYELYVQGISDRSRRDIDGSDLAIAAFHEALEIDPHYAAAWAALAETLGAKAIISAAPVAKVIDDARYAALRAIELDDTLAQGHTALGYIYLHHDRDFERAEAEALRAQALDDHYGRNWHLLAILRAWQGRTREAMDAVLRARELEPMAPLYNTNFVQLLYQTGRYAEAIKNVQPLIDSQPANDQARSMLIRALVASGDPSTALEQLESRVSDRFSTSDAGLVYAHLGRRAAALAEIARIERLGMQGYGVGYDLAVIHAALGDTEAACTALERALADRSLLLGWMRLDPRMAPLRAERCFTVVHEQLYGVPPLQ